MYDSSAVTGRDRLVVERDRVRAGRGDKVPVRAAEPRLDHVHRRRADEAADEEVDGPVVELLRIGDLLELALAHHRDAVAHRHRLDLVVGDVDRRHAEVVLEPRDLRAHLDAELRVEVREGLVHEERLRLADDRAAHRDALALAAGERARLALEERLEVEDAGGVLDAALDLVLRDLLDAEAEGDVLEDGEVRVERVALEHHRDVAIARRHVVHDAIADPEHAARDLLEPGDHPERGRLAATGRADEDHELTVYDVEIQSRNRQRSVRVDLLDRLERDGGHRGVIHPCVPRQTRLRFVELRGKTAVVTGASSGIGAATVRRLRDAGVLVAGGARRAERIDADVALELDVTDETSSRAFVDAAVEALGGIDILFNNAGLALGRAPFSESRPEDEEAVVHTNVDGVLRITRLCLPHVRDEGHILFMGSVAGRQAYPHGASYIASKFAVRGFSYALREDLLGRPIRVTTVDAGLVETEFSLVRFYGDQEKADAVYDGVDPVTPEEVADCVLFALTRPLHVNIDEIVIKALQQSSGARVVRRGEPT